MILSTTARERLTLAVVIYAMSALVAWTLSVAAAVLAGPGNEPILTRIFTDSLIDGLIWPVRVAQLLL